MIRRVVSAIGSIASHLTIIMRKRRMMDLQLVSQCITVQANI